MSGFRMLYLLSHIFSVVTMLWNFTCVRCSVDLVLHGSYFACAHIVTVFVFLNKSVIIRIHSISFGMQNPKEVCHSVTHTHTHLTALCPGLPGWAGTRKVKTNQDFTEARDRGSGSGNIWAVYKCAPQTRQITMPAQAGCPSCRPTNSVKALKASVP